MKDYPQIIEGGKFRDTRGIIKFVNEFRFDYVKRFYIIESNEGIVRAWQGHKIEKKYFYVVKGRYRICSVKIDDWKNPSKKLIAQDFLLNEEKSKILCLPSGYANGIQAGIPNSVLLVFSTLELDKSISDDYRFDAELWFDWNKPITSS